MGAKSWSAAAILAIGLLALLGPKLTDAGSPATAAAAGSGDCFSEAQDYSTPVLCE